MKFVELSEKAKEHAINVMYEEIQQHRIAWEIEGECINERVSELLDEYHCHEKEIEYKYDYSKVYFSEIETTFDIEELLGEREDLKELLEELFDISAGNSDVYTTFSSLKSNVSFFVDYVGDNEDEKWEFIKKYSSEFELEINGIEVSLIFGSHIQDFKQQIMELFEKVMEGNGRKLTEYLYPKIDEMRMKIVEEIQGTLNYLESDDCVRSYLTDYPEDYEFDEEGNKLAAIEAA